MSLQTSYEFTLPRGYVDHHGELQRVGTMRLATARDELAPLRHPTVTGPDDPRLTILVLARVVEKLGTLDLVSEHEIEGLFAVDLAYLQDFYGVINFGTQEEYEALLQAQQETSLVGGAPRAAASPAAGAADASVDGSADDASEAAGAAGPSLRRSVEELPRKAL